MLQRLDVIVNLDGLELPMEYVNLFVKQMNSMMLLKDVAVLLDGERTVEFVDNAQLVQLLLIISVSAQMLIVYLLLINGFVLLVKPILHPIHKRMSVFANQDLLLKIQLVLLIVKILKLLMLQEMHVNVNLDGLKMLMEYVLLTVLLMKYGMEKYAIVLPDGERTVESVDNVQLELLLSTIFVYAQMLHNISLLINGLVKLVS